MPHRFSRAKMGQVCPTAISSNHACHHSLHCLQFSDPECSLGPLSDSSKVGVRDKDPSSFSWSGEGGLVLSREGGWGARGENAQADGVTQALDQSICTV